MPQPVDVGSVLGGRYKVTAYVLASADRDLVLDGMDQVLNRPVSILVASPSNAGQIAATAREVATGERAGNIQVLDLGETDESTYLVTNRASSADLLDLVVPQDAPFVEPFFTDTLGSEIFGGPRSTEPETYDDEDEYGPEDDEDEDRPVKKSRLSMSRLPKLGRGAAAGAGAAAAGAGAAAADAASDTPPAATAANPVRPPAPSVKPSGAGAAAEQPKVSLWSESDYQGGDTEPTQGETARNASRFPAAAASDTGVPDDGDDQYDEDDDDRGNNPKYTRVLVGVVLAIILVTVVALSVNQLSNFFSPDPEAGSDSSTTQVAEDPTDAATSEPGAEEETTEPTTAPVPPVPTAVTRLVPDNPGLNAETDADLAQIVDGNPGSFWGSLVYANETFGGLAQNMALVVELEEESTINQIEIQQLNGSGGNFTVLLNDEPTLEGAQQIAESSFTGPTINIPVPAGAEGEPATARYIIVNLTQLPRLTNVQAVFPWGVRIAEISAS